MLRTVLCILLGYLSGSVLYARVFFRLIKKGDITELSGDRNPGTSNAFAFGGFWCGLLTLIFDLMKGFLPVFLFNMAPARPMDVSLSLVMAAPVLGHAFPLFYKFSGGKGIAVSFGCFLGLFPFCAPFVLLALSFIFFSVILRIDPHFHRTIISYISFDILMLGLVKTSPIWLGSMLITAVICTKMFTSHEKKEKMRIKLLWMH